MLVNAYYNGNRINIKLRDCTKSIVLNGSSTPSTSDMLDTLRDSLLAATGIDLKVELEGCETSEDIRAAMESIKKKADKLKAERNARTTH